MDRLPTTVALNRRNMQVEDNYCRFCNSFEESADHIFIACRTASIIWNFLSSWRKIPSIYAFSRKDLFLTHRNLRATEKKKDVVHGLIIIACWCLWRARNNAVFSNSPVKIEGIIGEIKALGYFWYVNRSKYKEMSWGVGVSL
ncbi:putative reverse transcriptase zinc-binding domain-containing protein [Helianthus annuus]|nr:putative reverse transcriptase zinc-binding domain-containing protein [Helianthus annuus]KAJ0506692.1 putative reverse transcriptase zinc-binding domain-containing protein [Helianthus annuus]KAJ0676368.1 putative reverse transcriptase zinc-binding domain-containing protein [Helianthus annuus]KAJ0679582.1 putative reverse transcriptase zinc-binding domain-containing protein [Helianthus annuus]